MSGIASTPATCCGGGGRGAKYLDDPSDAPACERMLLRQAGKSQDGVVSRFINRPISRIISRVLLKFPITPNAWTMLILILPLVACVFLVRGDYAGFVLGTALFQIYNIFDGCDGEIARMLQDSFAHAADDMAARALAEAQVEADQIATATRNALAADGELLSPDERGAIETALAEVARVRAGDDHRALAAATSALNRATDEFASRRMDRSVARALKGRRIDALT
jgi:hypothetical protein